MNIYHIYRGDKWYALALISDEQATLVGDANPGTTRIETWDGKLVWRCRPTRH